MPGQQPRKGLMKSKKPKVYSYVGVMKLESESTIPSYIQNEIKKEQSRTWHGFN